MKQKLYVATLVATGVLTYSAAQAQTNTTAPPDPVLVEIGLRIAPVQLNLTGKDRAKVGFGSYLVNAGGGCNDCHTNPNYDPTGDPFRGMPKKVNAAGYLGGGIAFGPFTSRNITPDSTGQVMGGLENFKRAIKTGEDAKKLHPEISPLLQVMPWPVYQDLADRDLEAIYAYLTSIPCLEGGQGVPANRCATAAPTTAVAGPKDLTTILREVQLDGSKSTSSDGGPLQYRWAVAPGGPPAAIIKGNTATPSVQFVSRNAYKFELTVTDSAGKTATDSVTVNYAGR
jgi:hypothetical protein